MKKKLIYKKKAYQATFIKKLCELNFFNWIFFSKIILNWLKTRNKTSGSFDYTRATLNQKKI